MRATSRVSLEEATARFDPVLRGAGVRASELGEQLFALVDALDGSGSLRRTLTDPSIDGDAKAGLSRAVLARATPEVIDLVDSLVRSRWSAEADLAEAIEELGFQAVLASAEADDELVRVEDELFRITRALIGQREVRRALFDTTVAADRRIALVDQILAGRAAPVTALIARRATAHPRGRRFAATLGHAGDLAAARRNRLVASVTSAAELSDAQRDRLAAILGQAYGGQVQLNVTVDAGVIGGLRIQIGSDVVDSTVLSRLDDARRRLAS
ncbi:F0F1 ATP synthase subunit delta [Pengzhenrongella sicca]|uniref:ATP synthase subunit delta n=1 Tax=Pengzhenrongella sicca TaxID=2819238 RepID=A0A8A4ZCZ1_9MICO|nr:F0F1 ATP synthase subunit delta [Pengzhenrongella sicca]QTE28753.1 F0F1 ATP synthase subunit delta [Pengzhenrongella sicca]